MPEQQQSGQDNSLDFLWAIALLIGGIILIWYFGKSYISTGVLYVRFYEIIAVNFVLDLFTAAMNFIGLSFSQSNLSELGVYIRRNLGSEINFSDIANISTVIGNYTRYFFTLLTLLCAASLYFWGPTRRFRHIFDTKSLRNAEQINWPQITPVVKLDLVNTKLDDGPWAFALSPMNFCKKSNLLDIEEKGGKYSATLKRGAAYRVLSLQLGSRWVGVDALPMHLKALFAIFAMRINGDKKNAENLLDQLSLSSTDGKLNFNGVEELLRKNKSSKKVAQIINAHGYVTTVFASMLVGARSLGVIATAEFIWLKPVDRRMWYMLNSVGRATAVAEICGAFAHWLAEKKMGLPLVVPMVEEGVRGLEVALSEIIYKPDETE